MSNADRMLTVRHLGRSVWHMPIELEGKPLAAARRAEMDFDEYTDVCRIVFGDKADEEREHSPPLVFTPMVKMPEVVWKVLLESKQYGRVVNALVEKGDLVTYG